jgi:hypothetical protein
MYLVINKWVTAVKVSNFSGHYLCNHSNWDIGVLGYIGIVWPKEHPPGVRSFPPGTPCICLRYIYQLILSNICVSYIYQLILNNICVRYIYQLILSNICVSYIYQLSLSNICVRYIYQLSLSNICVSYIYQHTRHKFPMNETVSEKLFKKWRFVWVNFSCSAAK